MLICLLCFVKLNGYGLSKHGVDELPAERDEKEYFRHFITSTKQILQVGFIWPRVHACKFYSFFCICKKSAVSSGNSLKFPNHHNQQCQIHQKSMDKCTLGSINYIDGIFFDYKVNSAWLFQKSSFTFLMDEVISPSSLITLVGLLSLVSVHAWMLLTSMSFFLPSALIQLWW